MGYCMNQVDSHFVIKSENKVKALEAIKALGKKRDSYSWVTSANFVDANTLQEAMTEWRWNIQEDKDGNVSEIEFNGEKSGDDETLFQAIAPFVEDGCFIEMRGEDGAMWRWCFSDGAVEEKYARVEWD